MNSGAKEPVYCITKPAWGEQESTAGRLERKSHGLDLTVGCVNRGEQCYGSSTIP